MAQQPSITFCHLLRALVSSPLCFQTPLPLPLTSPSPEQCRISPSVPSAGPLNGLLKGQALSALVKALKVFPKPRLT